MPTPASKSATENPRRARKAPVGGQAVGHQNPLAGRLANFRRLHGLSLEQVAGRAEITKSYLSKLERGLSSPTIATVLKLARALDISPEQLISESAPDDSIVLVKAADRTPFSRSQGREGYTYEAIAAHRRDKAMMPFIMSPPSDVNDEQDLVSHAGEELIYLISGSMEVIFADRVIRLEPGDSLYFDASQGHRSRSVGDQPAQALVVTTATSLRAKLEA